MLRVSHKFHHIFYLWLNTSYTHHIHLWLNTSICRFWVIDVMSFLCGASHRHEEMERKSFMHFFFSGINNLRVWPISIFKCCHSWLQNPENKGEGGQEKLLFSLWTLIFFFPFSLWKEEHKGKCRSSAFIPLQLSEEQSPNHCDWPWFLMMGRKRKAIGEKTTGKDF